MHQCWLTDPAFAPPARYRGPSALIRLLCGWPGIAHDWSMSSKGSTTPATVANEATQLLHFRRLAGRIPAAMQSGARPLGQGANAARAGRCVSWLARVIGPCFGL